MESAPSLTELAILPTTLTSIGLMVYFFNYYRGRHLGRPIIWRWLGVMLVATSFFLTLRPLWNLINPETGYLYRGTIFSLRNHVAHYAMPATLLAMVIGFIVLDRREVRRIREEEG